MDKQIKKMYETLLKGTIHVNIYDREDKLQKTVRGENLITTLGMQRLLDMLTDNYNYHYPNAKSGNSLFKNKQSFLQNEGEGAGLRILEWEGKSKTVWDRHGFQNNSYFSGGKNAFDGDLDTFARWHNNYNENTYWTPGGDQQMGWVCDFGWTPVQNETFIGAQIGVAYPVENKNLHFESLALTSNDNQTIYVKDIDYSWTTGDGMTNGTITLLNAGIAGVNLNANYVWHDIPQDPIVGMHWKYGGDRDHGARCFISALKFSFDQGETRSGHSYPWVNGNPSSPSWESYYWDWPWYPSWQAQYGGYSYFLQSFPYAMKNPVQMAIFGNHSYDERWLYDFDFVGYKIPKMGAHAIGLGTGVGVPSEEDSTLFNLQFKKATISKGRNGTNELVIRSFIDFDEGNDLTFTEAGLFFPSDEQTLFKKNAHHSESKENGGTGFYTCSSDHNGWYKLGSMEEEDCDSLMSHTMLEQSFTKNDSQRLELVYTLNISWGS